MLWILTSLFFFWCAFREIRSSIVAPPGFDSPMPVSKPYLTLVLALAVLFAWPTVHRWHFQRFLSEKATELADNHRAKVHCNTMFDTMLDSEMLAAGHANARGGRTPSLKDSGASQLAAQQTNHKTAKNDFGITEYSSSSARNRSH